MILTGHIIKVSQPEYGFVKHDFIHEECNNCTSFNFLQGECHYGLTRDFINIDDHFVDFKAFQ